MLVQTPTGQYGECKVLPRMNDDLMILANNKRNHNNILVRE